MGNIVAQFKIEGESLTSGYKESDIKATVIQRLRNRSAIFDKIVEEDVNEDHEQLNDFMHQADEESQEMEESDADFDSDVTMTTFVDIELSVNEEQLQKLEADADLVYMKAISELESDEHQFESSQQGENVTHLAYRK